MIQIFIFIDFFWNKNLCFGNLVYGINVVFILLSINRKKKFYLYLIMRLKQFNIPLILTACPKGSDDLNTDQCLNAIVS